MKVIYGYVSEVNTKDGNHYLISIDEDLLYAVRQTLVNQINDIFTLGMSERTLKAIKEIISSIEEVDVLFQKAKTKVELSEEQTAPKED